MTPEEETIGARLKRLRLAAGLSQRELAAPGASYAYISRIEAGTRNPSVKALRKLASRLGISPGHLETGEHEPTGLYLLQRTSEGDTHAHALFTDEMEADEWAAILTAAENGCTTDTIPEFSDPVWHVEFVDLIEPVWAAHLAESYAAETVTWTIRRPEETTV